MADRSKRPRTWRWTRPWRGEGRVIEEMLLIAACGIAGALVAMMLGMRPVSGAVLTAGVAVAAVLYRRRR